MSLLVNIVEWPLFSVDGILGAAINQGWHLLLAKSCSYFFRVGAVLNFKMWLLFMVDVLVILLLTLR